MKLDNERKKQADIISEAARLFLCKGYNATSMDEISTERLGVFGEQSLR
ncbi:MAG: TetR family transcriptional regulator [Dehalococcoidia bacterium]|nr:TetR family transcriptional regulator [Dehalococcoidia bacterium]